MVQPVFCIVDTVSCFRINYVEPQGGPVDEEDLVKKKGKKPNGSKREECEEAVELYLEVRYN